MSPSTTIHWKLLFGLLIIVPVHHIFAQSNSDGLAMKTITMNYRDVPIGYILEDLMVDYDVPIGFEESILDRDHDDYRYNLDLPSRTDVQSLPKAQESRRNDYLRAKKRFTIVADREPLSRVLDELVVQMSHYKWEIRDGVVNIIPAVGRDERFKGFLDLRIKNFENLNNLKQESRSILSLAVNIIKLPEVGDYEKENHLFISDSADMSSGAMPYRDLASPATFRNLTLLELLNRLTVLKRGGWALRIRRMDSKAIPAGYEAVHLYL